MLLRNAMLTLMIAGALSLQAQTGVAVEELRSVETRIRQAIEKWKLPGAALAVGYQGRIVYARGFGLASRERQAPVEPDTPFRIGSISKPFTAVTLVALEEEGKLSLDDKLLDILPEYRAAAADPRMQSITVRQLLQHQGGWSSEKSGDPLFPPYEILAALGAQIPPSKEEIIQAWLSLPLDFAPGARYDYSNFGYLLLGRVIEAASGLPYPEAVRKYALLPAGVSRVQAGRTFADQRVPGEASYYSTRGPVLSVFSAAPELVPPPYGSFSMDLVQPAGGLVASAPDLVRFMAAVDGSRPGLSAAVFRKVVEKPAVFAGQDAWYGLGFQVAVDGPGFLLAHNGRIEGTYGLLVRFGDGRAFAFLTNTELPVQDFEKMQLEIFEGMIVELAAVRSWPSGDLSGGLYPVTEVPRVTGVAGPAAPGAVSPGGPLTIHGEGLGPAEEAGEVKVYFDGEPAAPLRVSAGQVDLLAPAELAGRKNVVMTLERNRAWSQPVLLTVEPAQ